VPLPVFYHPDGTPLLEARLARKVADIVEKEGTNIWFERDDAWWARTLELAEGTTRRNDTLDVWIDSGVSHRAVLRTRPDLAWPADVYLEATDQHRGWFQSSLITAIALDGAPPYKSVITHGFVVDRDTRKKVSKSEQGNYAKPMNAEHYVGKFGADIVRLWAASVEFTNEVPFSEETFALLTDAYRQFRNILRILLANGGSSKDDREVEAQADVAPAGMTTIDRWTMSRLQDVIRTSREGFESFEFRKVFQSLNNFCTTDLSALYIDITKDRLYCDAATSPRRMATQWVMRRTFEALARLLAPILAFTADEAWEYFRDSPSSVHLALFPEREETWENVPVEREVAQWLALRAMIAQKVEEARKDKSIGNALEASVVLEIAEPALRASLAARIPELEEFFIVSELAIAEGTENRARLTRVAHPKCPRCWRHRSSIGRNADHPELCDRCATVVANAPVET
jgi:isoleucyl-tRNA synthetase